MSQFIAFEGIDGSGKTTIIQAIKEELEKQHFSVVCTQEPTDTWIGRCVQRCIQTKTDPVVTAFSFISDRIVHGKEIQRWLSKYDFILCDRYADSTYAYQGTQLEDTIDDPIHWLKDLSKNRFPLPDVTFLFDINPTIAMKRIQDRDDLIAFEKVSFLKKVRRNYLALSKESDMVNIDATKPVDDIVSRCIDIIMKNRSDHIS